MFMFHHGYHNMKGTDEYTNHLGYHLQVCKPKEENLNISLVVLPFVLMLKQFNCEFSQRGREWPLITKSIRFTCWVSNAMCPCGTYNAVRSAEVQTATELIEVVKYR